MSAKLSTAMRACLEYYRDNEHNPDRLQHRPYTWTMRQANRALDLNYLCVGPGGWHIPSETGRQALTATTQPDTHDDEGVVRP